MRSNSSRAWRLALRSRRGSARERATSEIRFDGRVAIVTGAGGGLGRCHSLELARRGARVVVNDLGGALDGTGSSPSAADRVVEEITEAGGTAVANYDSVATREGGGAIVATALENFGRIDIVINNAGIARPRSFAKLTSEELERVLDVHLKGAFWVSQPAFRSMKESQYGRFVFTSSAAGLFGHFGQSNYGAAKMGLVGLSNILALEGATRNIKSNVIAPLALTRMTQGALSERGLDLAPEHVTPLVVYLASEECPFSHEIYSAGGGRYARVFIGLCPGWTNKASSPVGAEEVREHIGEIRDEPGYTVPASAAEESALAARGPSRG